MKPTLIIDIAEHKITTTAFNINTIDELMEKFHERLECPMSEAEHNALLDKLERAEKVKSELLGAAWT